MTSIQNGIDQLKQQRGRRPYVGVPPDTIYVSAVCGRTGAKLSTGSQSSFDVHDDVLLMDAVTTFKGSAKREDAALVVAIVPRWLGRLLQWYGERCPLSAKHPFRGLVRVRRGLPKSLVRR